MTNCHSELQLNSNCGAELQLNDNFADLRKIVREELATFKDEMYQRIDNKMEEVKIQIISEMNIKVSEINKDVNKINDEDKMTTLEDLGPVHLVHILKFLKFDDIKNLRLTSSKMNEKTVSTDTRLRSWKIELSETVLTHLSVVNPETKIYFKSETKFPAQSFDQLLQWLKRYEERVEAFAVDVETISRLLDNSISFPNLKRISVFHTEPCEMSDAKKISTLVYFLHKEGIEEFEVICFVLSQMPPLNSDLSHLKTIKINTCGGDSGIKKIVMNSAKYLQNLQMKLYKLTELNWIDDLDGEDNFPELKTLFISKEPFSYIHWARTINLSRMPVMQSLPKMVELSTCLRQLTLHGVDLSNLQQVNCELLFLKEIDFFVCSGVAGASTFLSKTKNLEKLSVGHPDEFNFESVVGPLPDLKEMNFVSDLHYLPIKGLNKLLQCCSSTLTKLTLHEIKCPLITRKLPQLRNLYIDSEFVSSKLVALLSKCWRSLETLYVSENLHTSMKLDGIIRARIPEFPVLKDVELRFDQEPIQITRLDLLLNRCFQSLQKLTIHAKLSNFGSLNNDFVCLSEIILQELDGEDHAICQLIVRSRRSLKKLQVEFFKKVDLTALESTDLVLPKLEDLHVSVCYEKEDEPPSTIIGISPLIQSCRLSLRKLYLYASMIPDFDESSLIFPAIQTLRVNREVVDRY